MFPDSGNPTGNTQSLMKGQVNRHLIHEQILYAIVNNKEQVANWYIIHSKNPIRKSPNLFNPSIKVLLTPELLFDSLQKYQY